MGFFHIQDIMDTKMDSDIVAFVTSGLNLRYSNVHVAIID